MLCKDAQGIQTHGGLNSNKTNINVKRCPSPFYKTPKWATTSLIVAWEAKVQLQCIDRSWSRSFSTQLANVSTSLLTFELSSKLAYFRTTAIHKGDGRTTRLLPRPRYFYYDPHSRYTRLTSYPSSEFESGWNEENRSTRQHSKRLGRRNCAVSALRMRRRHRQTTPLPL